MITWIILSPLFVGMVLAVILWLGWRHWPGWLRGLGLLAMFGCYLLMTPLLSEALTGALESTASHPCTITPQAVVVLAGGAKLDAREGEYADLNLASMRRLIGGVAVWQKQSTGAPLVLSGGSGSGRQAESSLMAALAEQLGVPATMIRTETRSTTTWQNAHEVARMLPPVPRKVWLVTSAMHMSRARYAMQQAGFQTCSVPVDYRHDSTQWITSLLPDGGSVAKTNSVLHEVVGRAWYHLKAWHESPR